MIRQVLRLSFVGAAATLVHLLVGLTLIHASWVPLIANAAAFCVAFFVRFTGHFGYTFAAQADAMTRSLIRFVVVALAGFAANEAILAGLVEYGILPPATSLLASTGLAAAGAFLLCRRRALRPTPPAP